MSFLNNSDIVWKREITLSVFAFIAMESIAAIYLLTSLSLIDIHFSNKQINEIAPQIILPVAIISRP
jgi:hypothetical protein